MIRSPKDSRPIPKKRGLPPKSRAFKKPPTATGTRWCSTSRRPVPTTMSSGSRRFRRHAGRLRLRRLCGVRRSAGGGGETARLVARHNGTPGTCRAKELALCRLATSATGFLITARQRMSTTFHGRMSALAHSGDVWIGGQGVLEKSVRRGLRPLRQGETPDHDDASHAGRRHSTLFPGDRVHRPMSRTMQTLNATFTYHSPGLWIFGATGTSRRTPSWMVRSASVGLTQILFSYRSREPTGQAVRRVGRI